MADYSENDVKSLAQKLGEFKETLTPGEQAALTEVVQRAMPEESDVQGFSYELHADPINRKLLVIGLLDILYPEDLGLDETC